MTLRQLIGISALACIAANAATPGSTRAQVDQALRASTIQIDGREHPELVPYSTRMCTFFNRYKGESGFPEELTKTLPAADLQTLKEYASWHDQAEKDEGVILNRSWLEVADRADSMSAAEIASEMKKVRALSDGRQVARYRAVIAKLSPAGQELVNNFVVAHVRPMVLTDDEEALANRVPDFYKAQIIGSREYVRSGKWPAFPKEKTAVQQKGRANGAALSPGSSLTNH